MSGDIKAFMSELATMSVDDQIRKVKATLRKHPEILAEEELAVWIDKNKTRILELVNSGELES